jgi:hypothetical protein
MTSPIATVFAQKYLAQEVCQRVFLDIHTDFLLQLWLPFFNLVSFVLGVRITLMRALYHQSIIICPQTYFNTKVKKLRLEAEKAKKDREPKKD